MNKIYRLSLYSFDRYQITVATFLFAACNVITANI